MQLRNIFGLFVLLAGTTSLQMLARSTFIILLPNVQDSLALSDTYLGLMQGPAGLLAASLLSLQTSWLMDRFSNIAILRTVIIVWMISTFCCGISPSPIALMAARTVTASTEFMMVPLVYAWLPAVSRKEQNLETNLLFGAVVALGASAGYVAGPLIAEQFSVTLTLPSTAFSLEPWRLTLMLLPVTGASVLLLTFYVVRQKNVEIPVHLDKVTSLRLFTPEMWRFFGAAGMLSLSVQATEALISVGLIRKFHSSLSQVGNALGASVVVTSLISFAAVWVFERLRIRYLPVLGRLGVMLFGLIAGIPIVQLFSAATTIEAAVNINLIFLFSTCVANALVPTILQDLSDPVNHKRVFSIYNVVSCGMGSMGPLLVGSMSQHFYKGDLLYSIGTVSSAALGLGSAVLVWNIRCTAKKNPSRKSCLFHGSLVD